MAYLAQHGAKLKASLSATKTTFWCSCRTEAGTSGVTGPQNDL